MAYVQPNTSLRILSGVPLDITQEHTIRFSDHVSQLNYFSKFVKPDETASIGYQPVEINYSIDKNQYIRVNNNTVKVSIPAAYLQDCNYIMFQNSAWSSKWFYAFITEVNYINDLTSEIQYKVDVLQTWLPGVDYELKECFVEREHSTTDALYSNLVPETINPGTPTVSKIIDIDYSQSLQFILIASSNSAGDTTNNGLYFDALNYYTPLYVYANLENIREVETLSKAFTNQGHGQNLLSIYGVPSQAISSAGASGEITVNPTVSAAYDIRPTDNLHGYKPKNNKLFQFPYSFLKIENHSGNEIELQFEYMDTQSPTGRARFTQIFQIFPFPQVILVPDDYMGGTTWRDNLNSSITFSNFPQIPTLSDAYAEYFALNKNRIAQSDASFALNSLMTLAVAPSPVTALSSAVSVFDRVTNRIATAEDLKNAPRSLIGQQNWDMGLMIAERMGFTLKQYTLDRKYAKIVDDYFSRFGYACNEIKVPNIAARPVWSYVRTAGCIIKSKINNNDSKEICDIFDRGVTFWSSGESIGNYDLDNKPAGE